MASSTLFVRGTFDIAQGRQSLRSHIASQQWSATLGARATTALTAIGELILQSNDGKSVPIKLHIQERGDQAGIRFEVQVVVPDGDPSRFNRTLDNLDRATDQLEVSEHGDTVQILAYLQAG